MKLFLPTLIVVGIMALAGLYVWIMDPILHFTQDPGPDLSSSDNYVVVDKYNSDSTLQLSVNFSLIFPAYNEV